MKILNCHIENFGKLSGYDRDFTDGCNSIMASNGQGKSTLAAFIRVMFYGFEGEGKRKTGENERKRYEPWQGGVYGGRLTFTDGEGTYILQRTFGAKASEDTFELRDAATNMVSDTYGENIGEQLFLVNAESYMRTAYIGQNDVVTHTTDGINAMIGGIADSTNDLDSYEKALTRLTDLLNKESPTRATGSLYKLQNEVTALHTGVREGSVILDSIHRIEDSMGERQRQLEAYNAERDRLMDKQREIAAYKDRQALKDKWDGVREEYRERLDEVNVRRVAFPKELPTPDGLAAKQELAQEYNRCSESVNFYTLSAEEQNRLESLGNTFMAGMPDMSETTMLMRRWREHDKSLTDETGKKAELKVLRSELDSERRSGRTLPPAAVAGMILILAAMTAAVVSVIIMPSDVMRLVGVAVSALILAGGILLTVLGLKRHRMASDMAAADIEREIEELETDIHDGEDYRRAVAEETKRYLDRYRIPLDPVSVADDLRSLHTMADEYIRLKDKRSEYEKVNEKLKSLKRELDGYIRSLGIEPESDPARQLGRLSMDLRSLGDAMERMETAKSKVEDFKHENDTDMLDALRLPDNMPALEEISERLKKTGNDIDSTAGLIRDESIQHDALAEKLEQWEEDQNSLALKEQELVDGKRRYKNLKKASKYLTLAKESITAKYMEPLLTGFTKYYGSVTGASTDMYRIDANSNITVEELGGQRDTSLLSTGYQDLIGFCLRLSLIDAMYEGEKPILILDDPFVNLDAERLKGAQRLIDRLAQSYQMIYFTCR